MASNCRPLPLTNNEIPVGIQLFESGSLHADAECKASFQEKVVGSHSFKQSSHFAQSHVDLLDERILTFAQPIMNSFCSFFSDKKENAQSEQPGAFMLNASASLDSSFPASKLRRARKLTQERRLSFDRVPAVFSDDVVKPNLPVSDSLSSSLIESFTNGNQPQLHHVLPKQRGSSRECNERTPAKMEVREKVQVDVDADTKYPSLLRHLSFRLRSSSAKDNEERRQDVIKSCPSVLVRGSERIKNMHEELARPTEMNKVDLSDDIANESILMKTLQSKGGGGTIAGASTIQHSGSDAITSNVATVIKK